MFLTRFPTEKVLYSFPVTALKTFKIGVENEALLCHKFKCNT